MTSHRRAGWGWRTYCGILSRGICAGLGMVVFWSVAVSIASATDQSFSYVVDATTDQNFLALVRRAEMTAVDLINRAFGDPNTTEVSLTIGADRFGQITPLLTIRISRSQWQSQPTIRAWAKYPPNAAVLLGFRKLNPGYNSTPASVSVSSYPSITPTSSNPNSEPNFYN
jgi:hypothetical protein